MSQRLQYYLWLLALTTPHGNFRSILISSRDFVLYLISQSDCCSVTCRTIPPSCTQLTSEGHGRFLYPIEPLNVMTFDCHVVRRLLRNSPTRPCHAIWISDAAFAESVQRFTCVHRRHGSSVPGPLEAKRRATRRKNTSLVPVGRVRPPPEVGSLLGPGRRVEWWDTPSAYEAQAGPLRRELSLLFR